MASIFLFAAFLMLLPFKRVADWRVHGLYTSFIIALFAEMFGFPLTIYFISSYFGQPSFPTEFLDYMNFIGMPTGLVITILGILLIVLGWRPVYRSHARLVKEGVYSYMRHPQYLGIILVTFGWLIHWPTVPTVLMWPILLAAYYRLARREEKELEARYGEEYREYKLKVPMFLPIAATKR